MGQDSSDETLVVLTNRPDRAANPYEVSEIIALPVVAGLPAYLSWVAQETAT